MITEEKLIHFPWERTLILMHENKQRAFKIHAVRMTKKLCSSTEGEHVMQRKNKLVILVKALVL